jgi:hypothetical protein
VWGDVPAAGGLGDAVHHAPGVQRCEAVPDLVEQQRSYCVLPLPARRLEDSAEHVVYREPACSPKPPAELPGLSADRKPLPGLLFGRRAGTPTILAMF